VLAKESCPASRGASLAILKDSRVLSCISFLLGHLVPGWLLQERALSQLAGISETKDYVGHNPERNGSKKDQS
jgi:hypothetical protein